MKEMKDEADKYRKTQEELRDHLVQEKLFKLFHAEADMKKAEKEFKSNEEKINDLVSLFAPGLV